MSDAPPIGASRLRLRRAPGDGRARRPPARPSGDHRSDTPTRRPAAKTVRPGDRIFNGARDRLGVFISVLIGAIGAVPVWRGGPVAAAEPGQLPHQPRVGHHQHRTPWRSVSWTCSRSPCSCSVFALVLAMPIALGIAIFLTEYSPKRLARPARLRRSTCWPPCRRSSTASGASGARPRDSRRSRVAQREPRLVPAVRDRQRLDHRRRHDLHRRHRARRDDPADHHRGHPRGVRPDPGRRTSRRRSRSARPGGRSCGPRSCRSASPATSAGRCSASAARSARRWRST